MGDKKQFIKEIQDNLVNGQKKHKLKEIIDYWIPESIRGKKLPETEILIPPEAVGLYADCPIGVSAKSKDSWAEITFYIKDECHSNQFFEKPFDEFERIAKKYLIENKKGKKEQ